MANKMKETKNKQYERLITKLTNLENNQDVIIAILKNIDEALGLIYNRVGRFEDDEI